MSQFDLQPVAVAVVEIVDAQRLWREQPVRMAEAAASLQAAVAALLERHGGRRIDARGAELVVRFEGVLDAAEWALALLGAPKGTYTDELDGLELGIGIDVGILYEHTAALSGHTLASGEAVGHALRLAATVAPNRVALSPTSADLLGELAGERAQSLRRRLDANAPVATLAPASSEDTGDEPAATQRRPADDTLRSKLPNFTGTFIGRARELGQIAALIDADTRRAALCGAAGSGKSRLAVEFARAWLIHRAHLTDRAHRLGAGAGGLTTGHTRGQAWFCELSDADSLEAALLSVARTTGVQIPRSEASDELENRLAAAFSERGPTLLILDDVDRLAQSLQASVDRWLEAAPDLRVILTSQRPVDDASSTVDLGVLGPQAARAVLEDRLMHPSHASGRRRSRDEMDAVVANCGRLPLALELTAATLHHRRNRTDSPRRRAAAAERTSSEAGSTADSGSPSRAQNALADALERSWLLLDAPAQAVLEVCTVFEESFSAEAAIAVIEGVLGDDHDAEDLLGLLREHSLVRVEGRVDDTQRLVMLVPMRQFVGEHIDQKTFEAARRAHLAYFAQWAVALRTALQNDRERRWIERGRVELANLYRAVDYAKTTDLDKAVPIIEGLGELDTRVGPLGGFMARAEAVCDEAERAERPDLLVRTLCVRGDVYAWTGQYESAERDYRRGQELADTLDDTLMSAYMQSGLGFSLAMLGREQSSLALVQEAVERVEDSDAFSIITMLTSAAIVSRWRGHTDQAIDYLHRTLVRARRRQNRFSEASGLFLLGSTLSTDHQFDEAIRCLSTAAEHFRAIDDRRGHLMARRELGRCYNAIDEMEMAEECYREAMELSAAIGALEYTAAFRLGRGRSRFSRGEYGPAEQDLLEAAIAVDEVGHIHLRLSTLLYLGATYAALERVNEAMNYFERVETIFADTEVTREKPLYEVFLGYVDAARARECLRSGDDEQARTLLERAYERAAEPSPEDGSMLYTVVDEAARLRDFLDRRVEEGALPPDGSPQKSVLRLCRQMRWFAVDDDEPTDISRRGPFRRILRALVDQRQSAPGEPLNAGELVDAGWPDEVLTPESGSQRLYMTVSRMRSQGLKDVVETIDNGYLIDPNYTPQWVEKS